MPLTAGTRIGVYEIVAPIGAGGMGEVYRAWDTKLNRDVALKILPDMFAGDPDRLARFTREAQTLAALNDPHIAHIYGLEGQDGQEGIRALAMEFVDGEDLAQRLVRGPIPLDEALAIARQMTEGIEVAHDQGIIHRDLKPANIKLTPEGVVKILDFGLAKAIDPMASSPAAAALTHSPTITMPAQMTAAGMILGTAAYMAPEQAKGRPVDKRADVWAFGCVLFEMLTGKKAFEGEDVSDTLAAVLRSEPDWSALPPATPSAIRTLISRCLEKERRRRVASISVALFLLSEPAASVTARPEGSTSVVGTSRASWRTFAIAAAAVVVTAVVVAAGAWRLRPSNVSAPVTRFVLTLPQDQTRLQTVRPNLAISPDGTELIYIADNRLYVRSLFEFDAHPIAGAEGIGNAVPGTPAFSPDGRSVAFYLEGAIRRIGVGGGAAVTVCPADNNVFGISWDASGIVFGQSRKGIFRCSPNGGAPERLIAVGDDEVPFRPQILPGGTAVLFSLIKAPDATFQWDKAQAVVEALASHKRTFIVNGTDARYLPTGHLLYALRGVVFAIAFDPARLTTSGGPVPVIEGVRRAATTTGTAHFVTSETGALAYLPGPVGTTSGEWAIALADRTGAVKRATIPPGPYVHVRASRDGSRLAIGSDDGKEAIAWIYDLSGASAMQRLTFGGQNRFPIWSPDGSRVAFQSTRDGDAAIFVQRVDGTGGIERLTKPEKSDAHVPESWSPDGRFISFSTVNGAAFSLWTLSVADRKATPFETVRSAEPINSVFSPDGHWIAYTQTPSGVTGRSPDRGVFVQPFPATGARYQIPSRNLDFHPVWGPKGTELVYVPSAVSGLLAVVTFSSQPNVTFGSPITQPARVTANRLSTTMRPWDLLPDGRMVGLVPPSEPDSPLAAAPQIRVILNWFEELKAHVPVK